MGKQVVDLVQEIPGHCFDPVQRMSKVLLALPGHKKKKRKRRQSFSRSDCRQTDGWTD